MVEAKGDMSWYRYISRQKAREQKAVADAVRAATPDRLLYVFYTCGGDTHRHGTVETFHDDWAWDYSDMRACADIATNEYYYHDFNSGWIGKDDMLTAALGAKGYELRFGMKNSYDYVCPGYKQDVKDPTLPVWDATQPIDNNAKAFGDLRLYEGFLKCLYTEGMIGGIAGLCRAWRSTAWHSPRRQDPCCTAAYNGRSSLRSAPPCITYRRSRAAWP